VINLLLHVQCSSSYHHCYTLNSTRTHRTRTCMHTAETLARLCAAHRKFFFIYVVITWQK
jgi:hypothetical protein